MSQTNVRSTLPGGFKSDLKLWCRLLLPGAVKRVYNLRSKQLVKLFSRLLLQDEDEMLQDLEKGDVAETIRVFFEKSVATKPAHHSVLTVQEVKRLFVESEDSSESLEILSSLREFSRLFENSMGRKTNAAKLQDQIYKFLGIQGIAHYFCNLRRSDKFLRRQFGIKFAWVVIPAICLRCVCSFPWSISTIMVFHH